jgi:hypothetical protein
LSSGDPLRDAPIFNQYLRRWEVLTFELDPWVPFPGLWTNKQFRHVLWYVKDHRRKDILVGGHPPMIDTRLSSVFDESDHPWQQGDGSVIKPFFANFLKPGELVIDPTEGSAKWAEEVANWGCRWIGCDLAPGASAAIGIGQLAQIGDER